MWGYENLDIIEKVYLKFLKFIFNFKFSILNCMVYGEIGRYLLLFFVKIKMIMYWVKVLIVYDCKFINVIYCYFYRCYKNGFFIYLWIKCIYDIFNLCGLFYIWEN